MYTITRTFGPICAQHAISRLPEGHGCRNMHGHNFYVHIILEAKRLNEFGMVIDFTELDALDSYLRSWPRLERGLNALFDDHDPTVEHLAEHVARWASKHLDLGGSRVACVRVAETDTCWSEYIPEPA
ncbi:6-carboxytetrahydropterin synthase [Yinghuangia sp. ASG 101]|uniref:6-pyruvoyl trahydropterin synthase family protein n=1 Tax=Yinghuangia sp. ASG 101 TaxID=2896848 RepID=UPI001E420573|nr:6-carboxytetrahydropterin synthase [Yinghuangia sp. ASG 101]UGQ10505.1 6-carboxytetrahydropterin synthase [Yinghuangia sp. ASG 101]